MSSAKTSPLFLTIASVVIIVFAVVITAMVENQTRKEESSSRKIITVGPVWDTDNWVCTSDKDFVVHGVLRGLEGAQLSITISDLGTQGLLLLDPEKMETFTVGSPGGHTMTISSSEAIVTGWLTLETSSDAKAICVEG